MSKAKKGLFSLLLVILLLGALFVVPTVWFKPWNIEHFYSRIFLQFALRHPMMLTSMRLLEPMGLIDETESFADQPLEDNPLFTHLETELAGLGPNPEDRTAFLRQGTEAISEVVIPDFTAYVEGWALYAEVVADEAGFHPDPNSRLG